MKNLKDKKIIIIVVAVLAIIAIVLGIVLFMPSKDDNGDNNKDNDQEEEVKYTQAYVEEYANSMFGDIFKTIEVEDQPTRFVIYVQDVNTNELLGRYYFDKETGMLNDADMMDQEQAS